MGRPGEGRLPAAPKLVKEVTLVAVAPEAPREEAGSQRPAPVGDALFTRRIGLSPRNSRR